MLLCQYHSHLDSIFGGGMRISKGLNKGNAMLSESQLNSPFFARSVFRLARSIIY